MATSYQKHKARTGERQKRLTQAGQDIGAMPPVADPARRAAADDSLRRFCETYFPEQFNLEWSNDHLKVIAKIERAVRHGGLFAMAMPRGSGKTTLCVVAALWALLTGRQAFVLLVAATADHAAQLLDNIKAHLSTNDLLLADYPEAVYPIRCLDNESRRCAGQRYHGRLTHIGWAADEVILPTIPASACSGAIVKTAGLLGSVRGLLYTRPDGQSVRPTFVLVDDPQTDQSARSPSQVHERLAVINGALLNLAGPGKKIAAVATVTVIRPDDLADQLLDRGKNSEWQGERCKMLYALPTDEKAWEEYHEIREASLRNDGDGREATEYYLARQAAMDAGAVAAWPARFDPGEVSAIQHAMNLRLRNPAAFAAEYQNEPLAPTVEDTALTPEALVARVSGQARGEVPTRATLLTAFIDVHDGLLYWAVCAWESNFTGHVVDYGTYPDQKTAYFTLREAKRTLAMAHPGGGVDAAIFAGLETLARDLSGREWPKAGGGVARLDKLLIDSGYKPGLVHGVVRLVGGVLMPSKGVGIKAGNKPMASYKRRPGERHGHHWLVPNVSKTSEFPHVIVDTNFWKTFVHARLVEPLGERGAVTLFGRSAREHELFAQHVAASESAILTKGHGREVREWYLRPGNPDNHWLDCLVGCAVAASMAGAKLGDEIERGRAPRQRIRLSELQARKARQIA